MLQTSIHTRNIDNGLEPTCDAFVWHKLVLLSSLQLKTKSYILHKDNFEYIGMTTHFRKALHEGPLINEAVSLK